MSTNQMTSTMVSRRQHDTKHENFVNSLAGLHLKDKKTWSGPQILAFHHILNEILTDLKSNHGFTKDSSSWILFEQLLAKLSDKPSKLLRLIEKRVKEEFSEPKDVSAFSALIECYNLSKTQIINVGEFECNFNAFIAKTHYDKILSEYSTIFILKYVEMLPIIGIFTGLVKSLSQMYLLDICIALKIIDLMPKLYFCFSTHKKVFKCFADKEIDDVIKGFPHIHPIIALYTKFVLKYKDKLFKKLWSQITMNEKYEIPSVLRLTVHLFPHIITLFKDHHLKIVFTDLFLTNLLKALSPSQPLKIYINQIFQSMKNIVLAPDVALLLLTLFIEKAKTINGLLFPLYNLVSMFLRCAKEEDIHNILRDLITNDTIANFSTTYFILKRHQFESPDMIFTFMIAVLKISMQNKDETVLNYFKSCISFTYPYLTNGDLCFSSLYIFLDDFKDQDSVFVSLDKTLHKIEQYLKNKSEIGHIIGFLVYSMILFNVDNLESVQLTLRELKNKLKLNNEDFGHIVFENVVSLAILPPHGALTSSLTILPLFSMFITSEMIKYLVSFLENPSDMMIESYAPYGKKTSFKETSTSFLSNGIVDINELDDSQMKQLDSVFEQEFAKNKTLKKSQVSEQSNFAVNRILTVVQCVASLELSNFLKLLLFLELFKVLISQKHNKQGNLTAKITVLLRDLIKSVSLQKSITLSEVRKLYKEFKKISKVSPYKYNNIFANWMEVYLLLVKRCLDESVFQKYNERLVKFVSKFTARGLLSRRYFLNETFYQYFRQKMPHFISNPKIMEAFEQNITSIKGNKCKVQISHQIHKNLKKTFEACRK